jgi:HD superfamily phosphohydrolase
MAANEDELFDELARVAPRLKVAIDSLTEQWLSKIRADENTGPTRDKQFNDAIWGTITLYPWEVALIDTPLFQRLRGVKQNGLAYLVFPGATHDRFTHICGVVEASQRIMENLNRNAAARRRIGGHSRHPQQQIDAQDQYVIRLAALIHDVGHGPFSHAIEPVLRQHYLSEFEALERVLRERFINTYHVPVSECVAALIVSSPAFLSVMLKKIMSPVLGGKSEKTIVYRLVMALVGASDGTFSGCLGGLISNQIDADKLDYMARDAHHAGLPIDFDTDRLITKMELLTVEENALSRRLHGLIERVRKPRPPSYVEIGISYGGTGAFEQMLIGRIFLYDRLYHHHKVRTADAMAQRLVHYATSNEKALDIKTLYASLPDDAVIRAFGNLIEIKSEIPGETINFPTSEQSTHLAKALLDRKLYKRAFAFAGRYIAGLEIETPIQDTGEVREPDSLPTEDEQDAERSRVMQRVNNDLADFSGRISAEQSIAKLARELSSHLDKNSLLYTQGQTLEDHHVIVDLPRSPYPARITTIACRENDLLDVPDLFYDPARWAEVYNIQRRTAYVFANPAQVEIVALAARIWFLRKYHCVLDESAYRFSTTDGVMKEKWIEQLKKSGALTNEESGYLLRPRLVHVPFRLEWKHTPSGWRSISSNFVDEFNRSFNEVLTEGIPALAEQDLRATLRCIFQYVQWRSEDGSVTSSFSSEKELQKDLARSLRHQFLDDITEGSKVAGGETDLIVGRRVVIENKLLRDKTDDPFTASVTRAGLQARRYVLPTGQKFAITVVGYASKTENGKFSPHECVRVRQLKALTSHFAEIRIAVRYGDTVPSAAR